MQESLLFKLDKWINKYITEKKSLNYSNNTIITYNTILESFYEYMIKYEDEIRFEDISKDILLEYININKKLSNSSKHLRLTILKSFFKYIGNIEHNIDFESRFSKLTIKKETKEIESLLPEEVERLLALFDKSSNSFNFIRDKLIVYILLFSGIRANELLNLKFSDIVEVEDGIYRLLIKGKGDKQRYEYIKKEKIFKELEYMKQFNTDFIAISNRKNLMTRVGLYNIVTSKLKKANIDKKGVHILRHTFAKILVANNVNLSTIKDLLGHENISTTMIYAKSNEENKIAAIGLL